MKKIMIAFCAVALAAVAQAATYNWSVSSTTAVFDGYNGSTIGTAYTGATAQSGLSWYFICANSITQGDLLEALRGGDTMADHTASVLASGTTSASGVAQKTFTADTTLVQGDGKMYSYFAVISGDNVFLSSSTGLTADTLGGQSDYTISLNTSKIPCDFDGTHDYASAGWYSAVPEPTSGLLLLLGMAGLALKRKNA